MSEKRDEHAEQLNIPGLTPEAHGETPLAGQGSLASINEPPGSTIGSNIPPESGGGSDLPPAITALVPDTCTIGDPSFTLDVEGAGFTSTSVINFAGHDEPTTFNAEEGTLSTGIDMDVWHGADVVPVVVKTGSLTSNVVDFTFAAAGAETASTHKRKSKRGG
jgi:hypothetical protein